MNKGITGIVVFIINLEITNKNIETMVLIRLESVRNRLCSRLLPMTRSANIKALNAPSQPPR